MSKQRKSPPKYVEKPEKINIEAIKVCPDHARENQDQSQHESLSDQPNQTKWVKWKKTKSP